MASMHSRRWFVSPLLEVTSRRVIVIKFHRCVTTVLIINLPVDRSAAFNQVLKSDFQQRYLGLYNFPELSTQTYTLLLVNGTEIDIAIPWSIYSTSKVKFTPDACIKTFSKEDIIFDMQAPKVEGLPRTLLTCSYSLCRLKLSRRDTYQCVSQKCPSTPMCCVSSSSPVPTPPPSLSTPKTASVANLSSKLYVFLSP